MTAYESSGIQEKEVVNDSIRLKIFYLFLH